MKAIDLDKWIQLLKKINFHDFDEEMQYDITSDEDIEFVKYLTCYSDYIKIGGSNNLSINSSVKVTILRYPEGIVVYTNLIEFVRGQLTYCFKIIEHFWSNQFPMNCTNDSTILLIYNCSFMISPKFKGCTI